MSWTDERIATLKKLWEGGATASQIAEEQQIPPSFLAKIVSQLSVAGLLQTSRGARGGVSLARTPEEISFLEVVEAIDGPMNTEVTLSEGYSEEFQERLRRELQRVTTTARDQLRAIKLSQLIKPPRG